MIPVVLAGFSLCAFAVMGILYSSDLSFGETLRLHAIAIGLAWLLVKRRILSRWEKTALSVLCFLVYMFMLAQFSRLDSGASNGLVLTHGLLGVAFLGVLVSRQIRFHSRQERKICLGVLAVCMVAMGTRCFTADDFNLFVEYSWPDVFIMAESLAVYFIVSHVFHCPGAFAYAKGILAVACIALTTIGIIGAVRITSVYSDYHGAIESFADGRYDEAMRYTLRLKHAEIKMQNGPFTTERTLEAALTTAYDVADATKAYLAIGDIASHMSQWKIATAAYKKVAFLNPDFANINTLISSALYEQGYKNEALNEFRASTSEDDVGELQYWALGIALAKMGQWEEANRILDRAIRDMGYSDGLEELIIGNVHVSIKIEDLVPAELLPQLNRITPYEVSALLRNRGWEVFHQDMYIGSTGKVVPVDIVAQGGTPGEEFIKVAGRQVSLHKRGYNIVVIDPQTGEVEDVDSFDTWENTNEGRRMGDYLKGIPSGKIVAAAISDEGSGGLVRSARAGLGQLGVIRFPTYAWKHALIGVKGAPPGTAAEGIGSWALARVGVLRGNMPVGVDQNDTQLRGFLKHAAASTPKRIAVYIPDLTPYSDITLIHN